MDLFTSFGRSRVGALPFPARPPRSPFLSSAAATTRSARRAAGRGARPGPPPARSLARPRGTRAPLAAAEGSRRCGGHAKPAWERRSRFKPAARARSEGASGRPPPARPASRALPQRGAPSPWKRPPPLPPLAAVVVVFSPHPSVPFPLLPASPPLPPTPTRRPTRARPRSLAGLPSCQAPAALVACVTGPAGAFSAPFYCSPFISTLRGKHRRALIGGAGLETDAGQSAPAARPAASRSRFRPDSGDKQGSWGGRGATAAAAAAAAEAAEGCACLLRSARDTRVSAGPGAPGVRRWAAPQLLPPASLASPAAPLTLAGPTPAPSRRPPCSGSRRRRSCAPCPLLGLPVATKSVLAASLASFSRLHPGLCVFVPAPSSYRSKRAFFLPNSSLVALASLLEERRRQPNRGVSGTPGLY